MPREIGYGGAGRLLALGEDVDAFKVRDQAAYAGTGVVRAVFLRVRLFLAAEPSFETLLEDEEPRSW